MPPSALASSSPSGAPRHRRRTLSSTVIDESVAAASEVVQKWHPDTGGACSLFLHSGGEDHKLFLGATADLHRAMLFFASHDDGNNSGGLVQAQELLQTAMRRLDIELRLLLLHGVDDDDHHDRIKVMISSIVGAMMGAGYGKECLSTFKSTRRAALASKLILPPGNSSKLGWEQVDAKIIQPWLAVAPVAFNSLFPAEKELCHAVFNGDKAGGGVGEAVLAAIVNDHATGLLAVAEAAVARARRAPERLFRVLDVHLTLVDGERKIQSVFNKEVASRAGLVVAKAAEAARAILLSFEAAILHKEPPSNTTPGGAVHPLTRYVMNYLVFLAEDYTTITMEGEEELEDWIWRLVSALLSKLESKAGSYREAALSYLFLANNTHYVATKVRGSSKLQAILGQGWAEAQSAKARGHVQVYTRAAWGRLISSISSTVTNEDPPPQTTGLLVMEAIQTQEQWMAADQEMAKLLRFTATAAVLPRYRIFYRRFGAALSLTPGDVNTMIAALFTNLPVPASQPQDPNEMSVTY